MTRFLWLALRRGGFTRSKPPWRDGSSRGMPSSSTVWRSARRSLWIAPLTWAFLVACGIVLGMQTAEAQQPYVPYRPSTPAFSPWLNLYQKNTGPLDNYHNYVQPQIQMWDTLQQQDLNIQRQGSSIRALGQGLTQLQQHGTVRPTGGASSFMNYSHYYPTAAAGAQRARAGRR